MAYEFHYTPTGTGVISGKEVLEQTEDAINDLGNTAISGVQEALDKAEQALTNSANAVDDAQTALNTANNAEGVAIQAQNDVSNLSGTVTNIGNRVTTAEGNITNLQGRMTTAEGNIGNLQTAVSTAQATANSAQQTATTARQQSYVFRYSSTVLVASSTNSNALLDNTDNLKVGDKVIDSSGVLFSITAIDTQNSTFTIGTALIDLAQDSDVVHKSGNETVGGVKTFSDNLTIYNSDDTATPKGLTIKNAQWGMGESGGTTVSNINFLDKNSAIPASVMASKGLYGQSYLRFSVRTKDSQNTYLEEIYYDIDVSGKVEFRSWHDNTINLGTPVFKWKDVQTYKVNSLEPSSLSLPSGTLSNQIDISSYFANTGTGDTNSYTASANGWIYLRLGDISSCQATVYDANNNRMWGQSLTGSVEQLTIPILKGQTLSTQWATGSSVNVATARFIPCQGNV